MRNKRQSVVRSKEIYRTGERKKEKEKESESKRAKKKERERKRIIVREIEKNEERKNLII